MHGIKGIDGLNLLLAILVAVGTDNRISCLTGLIFDTIEHSRIEMRNKVWYYYTYQSWSLVPQALCKGVWPVVHLSGQRLHLLLHSLSYLWRIAQSSTYSSYTYAQLLSDVFQ